MRLVAALSNRLPPRMVEGRRAASAVKERIPFAVRESIKLVTGRSGPPVAYTTREGGMIVHIRHGTRDVAILGEVLAQGGYQPPSDVEPSIGSHPRIVDAGGNIGLFGLYASHRWPQSRIVSYEPDPGNAALLARTLSANELGERWTLVEAAVANDAGTLPFVTGLYSEGHRAAESEEATREVPAVDLFESQADFLKMDIEGGEWAILTDPRLEELDPDVLVLEWHHRHAPQADARRAAVDRLVAAGYERIHHGDEYGSTGLLWAWRPSR